MQGVWRAAVISAAFDVQAHEAGYQIPAGPSVIADPPDGKLPYLPAAAKTAQRNREEGDRDPVGYCHPHGVPRQLVPPFPLEIVQDGDSFAILSETEHSVRVIPLDGRPHRLRPRVSMGPRLVPFVERYKIRPAFHTHAEVNDPNEIASVESLQKLMRLSPEFRICLDIGHFTAGNNDAVAYLREHHDRITHIHVKDRKRNGGLNVEWGTGDTPIKPSLVLIRDNRYPIYCIVEREFQGAGTALEQTRRDLEYMKNALV
jgi:Xylose isomerase-like TIM barrel